MTPETQRKALRLKSHDYAGAGAYFITICTRGHLRLFGEVEEQAMHLNEAGRMVEREISDAPQFYHGSCIDCFCVMPNHIHMIVLLEKVSSLAGTPQGAFPTVSIPEFLNRLKAHTTKLYIDGVKRGQYIPYEKHVWQKSYYDHIIRNAEEHRQIRAYIINNPKNWQEDKYFLALQ